MTVFTTLRFTPDQCKIGLEVVGLPAEHLARTHPECFNRPRSPYSPLMPRWLDQVATRTPIDPHTAVGGPKGGRRCRLGPHGCLGRPEGDRPRYGGKLVSRGVKTSSHTRINF
jgi:hypothetical protein